MPITYEYVEIKAENVTPDSLVFRRYKRRAPGILALFEEVNPRIMPALKVGPFIPVGTVVAIPIDSAILKDEPTVVSAPRLWGNSGDTI